MSPRPMPSCMPRVILEGVTLATVLAGKQEPECFIKNVPPKLWLARLHMTITYVPITTVLPTGQNVGHLLLKRERLEL